MGTESNRSEYDWHRFILSFIFLRFILLVIVCMWVCVLGCRYLWWPQKLEFKTVVSLLTKVLGTELRSSTRAGQDFEVEHQVRVHMSMPGVWVRRGGKGLRQRQRPQQTERQSWRNTPGAVRKSTDPTQETWERWEIQPERGRRRHSKGRRCPGVGFYGTW